MSSLLVHFEATEFVEFIGFISHMAHKLQVRFFISISSSPPGLIVCLQAQFTTVLEDLFAPLTKHVSSVISKPITGTDDKVARVDTKKAFLAFLSTIMSSNLGSVLVSQSKPLHYLL
jgi:exportin-T